MDVFAPLVDLVARVAGQVVATFANNWPFLLVGILSAAALKVYVGTERVADLFRRRTGAAVGAAVTAAVATPFCSCGTTAVILSMMASSVPWAPVVAFMVASPLTSPGELFLSAGLFGWPFALLFFGGSIALGLAGGAIAWAAEGAGLLRNQARFTSPAPECGSCATEAAAETPVEAPAVVAAARPVMSCCSAGATVAPSLGPGAAHVSEFPSPIQRWRLRAMAGETIDLGRRMVLLFAGFAAIGYTIIEIVPTEWITTLLGGTSPLSVVVAATLGIPFYVSSDANLPLVASLVNGGMGLGPAMAFLVTGAGTSIAAITGALLIARWRVVAIVVGTLWAGAIVLGLFAAWLL